MNKIGGKKKSLQSEALAKFVANLTLEKKALNVKILDLRELTTITDFFVICSSDSDVQSRAISDYLFDRLKQEKIRVYSSEGFSAMDWVILDLIDVVVHIFRPEVREYYALEKLWGDAKFIDVEHDD